MRSESDVATSWGERRAPRLGELLHRLLSEIGQLIDQRITLVRVELKEQVSTAVRDLGLVLFGAVLATLGLLLLLLALGFWVGGLMSSTAGGLALVGAVVIVAGAVAMMLALKELRRQRLVPETREELRRDAKWIKT